MYNCSKLHIASGILFFFFFLLIDCKQLRRNAVAGVPFQIVRNLEVLYFANKHRCRVLTNSVISAEGCRESFGNIYNHHAFVCGGENLHPLWSCRAKGSGVVSPGHTAACSEQGHGTGVKKWPEGLRWEMQSLLRPAGLFRTRLAHAAGRALCWGINTASLPLQPGEDGDVDPELSEVQSPVPCWLSGTATSAGAGAVGSWALLPKRAGLIPPSVCSGDGQSGHHSQGTPPQIPPRPPGDRRDLGFGSGLMLQPVPAVPCVAGRMQVLHSASAVQQLLVCPSRRWRSSSSSNCPWCHGGFGKRCLWVWDGMRLFCLWGPAPSSAQGCSRGSLAVMIPKACLLFHKIPLREMSLRLGLWSC